MIDALEVTLKWLAITLPRTLREVDPKVSGVAVIVILYGTAVVCTSYYHHHHEHQTNHPLGKFSPSTSPSGSPTKPFLSEKFTTGGLSPRAITSAMSFTPSDSSNG